MVDQKLTEYITASLAQGRPKEAIYDVPAEGTIFLKGKVVGGRIDDDQPFDGSVRVVYGIEQYFIPEGEGRNFSFWDKEAAAKVVVDDQGNAVLKQIYINDKPWP